MAKSGWVNGDPVGSERPRGKDRSERRGRFDPGWTPTETKIRDACMKQFCKMPEGSPNTEAYVNSPVWCRHPGCSRMNGTHEHKERR